MTRILPLGNCRAYLNRYGANRPKLKFTCINEDCNHQTLREHGRYFRTPVFKRRRVRLPIYRWYCPKCGQTLSVLPDFLVPGGHFVTQVREAALRRRMRGESFTRIAQGVASVNVGGVSPDTIKRWWTRYLQKCGDAAQWVAAELIKSGVKEDLLRLHSKGVNPTPLDTINWLGILLKKFFNREHLGPPLQGYFCFLNARLPEKMWL